MAKKLRVHAADPRGANRLSIDGIAGVVDLVEAMHYNIAGVPGIRAKPETKRAGRPASRAWSIGASVA